MIMASSRLIRGCLMSAASFLMFGGILSPINSFGRLFTAIQNDINTTAVETGWIGSASWATSFLTSSVAVVAESYIGYRLTTVLGSALAAVGYLLASYMSGYVGVLLFLGFVAGGAAGLCVHSTFCVLFKYFSSSAQTRASGIAVTGSSVATVLVTIGYEKMIPLYGWRFTLQITAAFCAILAIPASFFISPKEKDLKIKSRKRDEINESVGKKHMLFEKDDKAEELHKMNTSYDVIIDQDKIAPSDSWLYLLTFWRVWFIFGALMFPAMSWSVYWVNIISYFESIAIPEDDILLYVTIMTVSDVCGRITIVFFMNKLPLGEVNLLIASNFIMAVTSVWFVVFPVKTVLSVCSLLIGVGRGWYTTLPLKTGVELLEADNSDQGITLVMLSLGVGFTIGTLPAGAIYDTTGSYTYAFIINALLYLTGDVILVLLQGHKRMRRRRVKENHHHRHNGVQYDKIKETAV